MIIRQGLIIPVLISKAWIRNIFYFTRKTFTFGQGPATYHSTGIRQGLCFSQWSLTGTRFRFNRPILLSLGVLCLHLDSTILPKYIFFSHTHIVNYYSRQIISSQTRFHATHRKPDEFDFLNHCGPYSSQYYAPLKHSKHKVRLNPEFYADMEFWLQHLHHFNCRSFAYDSRMDISLITDACTTGGGATLGDFQCCYWNWQYDFPHLCGSHINILETMCAVLSIYRWEPSVTSPESDTIYW